MGVREQSGAALWIHDLSGVTAPRRLTLEGSVPRGEWTADGARITFASGGDIFEISADGTGIPERLVSAEAGGVLSWSRDGRVLAFVNQRGAGIWTFRRDGRVTEPFYESPGAPREPQFSPDGKWIAYMFDQAGIPHLWVQPFPPTGARVEVTRDLAIAPRWSPDGRTLFYVDPGTAAPANVFSVSVDTTSGFAFGRPKSLGIELRQAGNHYDITPDGRKFLVVRNAGGSGDSTPPRVHLVLNWTQELKERVPVR